MNKIKQYIKNIYYQKDKQKHFVVGFVISIILGILTNYYIGLIVSIIIGALKELYDLVTKKGTPDYMDFIVTSYGATFAMLIVITLHFIGIL